jgi:hypothetical protein
MPHPPAAVNGAVRQLRAARGESAALLDFAQKVLDDGLCAGVDALERTAGLAMQKAQSGRPPVGDPFGEDTAEEASTAEALFQPLLKPGDLDGGH